MAAAAELRRRFTLFSPASASASERGKLDKPLLILTGIIITLGLIMIYSVSFGPNTQAAKDPIGLFSKQAMFAGFGLVLMLVLARLDYHLADKFALWLMAPVLVVLAALLFVPGAKDNRWVGESGSIQPSEVAKLVTIVYIAAWASSKGDRLRKLQYGMVPFIVIVGVVAGLILAEPNLSTAGLIVITAFVMFFLAGADLKQCVLVVLGVLALAAIVYMTSTKAQVRVGHILVNPFEDPTDTYYQLREALIALGSGGLGGKGITFGGGQYGWVPAAHSDTIVAILGEELGFIGTCSLVGLYLIMAYRGFLIAYRSPDAFGRVLAAGITFWIFLQAFVNMGVVTQTVPLTGQPLPLVSAGGSSMVMTLGGIGLLLSISRGRPKPVAVPARAKPERQTPEATPRKHVSLTTTRPVARIKNATSTHGRWDGRTRVPGARRTPSRTRKRLDQ